MPSTQPVSFHRRLMGEAWRLVWRRRALWVFGLFGGLALSGAVIEPAFSGLARVVRLGTWWTQARAEDLAAAAAPVGDAISQACRLTPLASQLGLTAGVVALFAFCVFALVCLGGLIAGIASTRPLSPSDVLRRGWTHAWELFMIGFLARAYQLILLLLVALPVLFYAEGRNPSAVFAACLAILLFLPLAIGGQIITIFASIHAVRRTATVPESFEVAVRLFFARWLEALETGVILLAVSAVAFLAFGLAIALAAVVLFFLFVMIGAGGWLGGMAFVAAVGVLVLCVAIFVFAGLLAAFRLAVWVRFYERALHPIHGPRIVSRLKRWFHPAHVRG